ncbi:MAG TPA: prepilin-type N-terminal cleavage/methylation domain-containing protein [Patescibacteria group bacterium]|nr:prepilin-type N-terminal cleavage/methylation domain-containing protein [Patescibacteria group bacterium]
MTRNFSQKGFTLIELLIVIIIIGILAGVLIAVINPGAQQNRARDGVVRATMNKIALSTNGYISAYGRIPNEVEFLGGIAATAAGAFPTDCNTTTGAAAANCRFEVTSAPLSVLCDANGRMNTGTAQCYYYYCGQDNAQATGACNWSATQQNYRLIARAWGSPNVFMYRSSDSKMYLCSDAGINCIAL